MRRAWTAAVLGAALAMAACDEPSAAGHVSLGKVETELPVSGELHAVRVKVPVGGVEIATASGGMAFVSAEVRVAAEYRGEAQLPLVFGQHVIAKVTDGCLEIESAHVKNPDARHWSLFLTVSVPDSPDVTVDLPVGSVRIELPEANAVRVKVGHGDVSVRCPVVHDRLEVSAKRGNLDVAVADTAPNQGVQLQADIGKIDVVLPEAVQGSFQLAAKVGCIEASPRFGLKLERGVTDVRGTGQLGDGGPHFEIAAGSGSIDLH